MNELSIVSLAIYKVNYDTHGADVIENFVPFVREVLATTLQDPVQPEFVKEQLWEQYRLDVPIHGVLAILRRMVRRRMLRQDHKLILRIPGMIAPAADFANRRASALRQYNAVISKLKEFCAKKGKTWTDEEAGEALLSYLNQYAIQCLNVAVRSTVLAPAQLTPRHSAYWVNAFIRDVQESDEESFNYLTTVVKGSMLTNAIYCPDLDQLGRKFKKTAFYLDTKFVLRLLGYEGPLAQAPCGELVALLKSEGGQLFVFEQTRDEIRRVLDWCGRTLGGIRPANTAHRPVLDHFLATGRKESDIILYSEQLEASILKLGITITPGPHRVPRYQIDELKLATAIDEALHYRSEWAREHDVACIAAIFMLRAGRNPIAFEDTPAVFVTTNTVFAKTVFQFAQRDDYPHRTPACVGDYDLTNLVWVKRPLAAPDLPRKQIMANCYAALEPSHDLWEKYVTEVDKLRESGEIDAREHAALRYSIQARQELVDLTQGDLSEYKPGNAMQILDRLREDSRAEGLRIADEANARAESAEEEMIKLQETVADARKTRQRTAQLIAAVLAKSVFWGAYMLLVISTAISVRLAIADAPTWRASWVMVLAQAILLVVGFASFALDTTLPKLVRSLELWLAPRVLAWLDRLSGHAP